MTTMSRFNTQPDAADADQCFVCGMRGHQGTSILGPAVHEACEEWHEGNAYPSRTTSIAYPPFTRDQVKSMNAFQKSGIGEPETCSASPQIHRPGLRLVARKAGWWCRKCRHNCQHPWAYAPTTDWSWRT
jgi:hypothetical protein